MKKNNLNYILISLALLLVFAGEISFSHDKNPIESKTVQASSRLRRVYIPKRFQGTWYANYANINYKLKITTNSIGGNILGKTYSKFYYGSYKNVSDGVSKHNFVRYQGKTMIILFEKGGSDITFRVVNRHHRKALIFGEAASRIYFYRSRAAAKRYGIY